jgi:threonine dehydrogenase-like Zn-dependent dehydrogenase
VHVQVVEPNNSRIDLAQSMGIDPASNEQYDIVFHTSATSSGLNTAIELCDKEGRIIELSWYGNSETSLQLGGSFHFDRKQIIASQVSNIPNHKSQRWTYKSRLDFVFSLLQEIDLSKLITHQIDFENAPAFYDKLRKNKESSLTTIIKYD